MKKVNLPSITKDIGMLNKVIKINKFINGAEKVLAAAVIVFIGIDIINMIKN